MNHLTFPSLSHLICAGLSQQLDPRVPPQVVLREELEERARDAKNGREGGRTVCQSSADTACAESSGQMRSTLYSVSTRGDASPSENTAGCSPKAAPETARSRLRGSTGCLRERRRGTFPPGAVRRALHAPGKLSPRRRKGSRRLLQPTRGATSQVDGPRSARLSATRRAAKPPRPVPRVWGYTLRKRRRPNGRRGGAAPRPQGTARDARLGARGHSRPEASWGGGTAGRGARRSPSRPFSSRRSPARTGAAVPALSACATLRKAAQGPSAKCAPRAPCAGAAVRSGPLAAPGRRGGGAVRGRPRPPLVF